MLEAVLGMFSFADKVEAKVCWIEKLAKVVCGQWKSWRENRAGIFQCFQLNESVSYQRYWWMAKENRLCYLLIDEGSEAGMATDQRLSLYLNQLTE